MFCPSASCSAPVSLSTSKDLSLISGTNRGASLRSINLPHIGRSQSVACIDSAVASPIPEWRARVRAENARQEFDRNVLWAGVKCVWRRIQSRPSKIPEKKEKEKGKGEEEEIVVTTTTPQSCCYCPARVRPTKLRMETREG